MKYLIMHQTATKHDAIGNDIEGMFRMLSERYECGVFAENRLHPTLTYLDEETAKKWLSSEDTVVIYHHSVYWELGEKLISQAAAQIVIKYHNITPPSFFAPFNEFHTNTCRRGRLQTTLLASNYPGAFWLCDSKFNGEDVIEVPEDQKKICAPFHKIEQWAKGDPDETLLRNFMYSKDINLLFVGRIAPNKGHLFLLEIMRIYRACYSENIHLWVLGKMDEGLPGYNEQILDRIKQYGLQDHVHIVGEITDATMSAYYLGCDFYLCASEHEGFCVPIEEAQYFKLPIIARRSTAVPETMGSEQLILGEDPREYAAAIHVLAKNNEYRQWLTEKGRKNYEARFSDEIIGESFLKALSDWKLLPEKEIT